MKRSIILLTFLAISIAGMSQGVFDGFFRPKKGVVLEKLRAEGDKTLDYYFRPVTNMNAIQFMWDKETKTFEASTFSSAGIGLGLQHYVEHNGILVNNYGVNLLIVLDASQGSAGAGGAITINALQFVNIGVGYSFTFKQLFIPIGAVYTF